MEEKSNRMFLPEEHHAAVVAQLVESPTMPSLHGSEDDFSKQEIISLGQGFQSERALVVLGDPGSGKTTLARWIALQLSRSLLNKQDRVRVPSSKVNPNQIGNVKANTLVDLGITRIPILIRIADFAEYLSCKLNESEKKRRGGGGGGEEGSGGRESSLVDTVTNSNIKLEDELMNFVGYHPWQGVYPSLFGKELPKEVLHSIFVDCISKQCAVIILDGLDEIANPQQRQLVVQCVDQFAWKWVYQQKENDYFGSTGGGGSGSGSGSSSNSSNSNSNSNSSNSSSGSSNIRKKTNDWKQVQKISSAIHELGRPVDTGGNQLIITSRIAGYHSAPLSCPLTHVTIQPMQQAAIKCFCDSWMIAVHKIENNGRKDNKLIVKEALKEAKALQDAICEQEGVRRLAENPLLLTILSLVYKKQEKLPKRRAQLYRVAMGILMNAWKDCGSDIMEIMRFLGPLSAYLHHHRAMGLVSKDELFTQLFNAKKEYYLELQETRRNEQQQQQQQKKKQKRKMKRGMSVGGVVGNSNILGGTGGGIGGGVGG